MIVDQDSRYGLNQNTSASLAAVTVSATLGGTFRIDARKVRFIPYGSGTGNVPASNTVISQGSASGKLIGVWASYTAAPTAAGLAMPATGFIKIKQWNDVEYGVGALTGIGASATGASVVGIIDIVGDEASTVNANRLGNVNIFGEWFRLGLTSGASNQTLQIPNNALLRYAAGVYIEKTAGQKDYEFYPNAGTTTTTGTEADRGKVVWIDANGLVRIGNSGAATNGYTPPSGLEIVVPNIFLENCTTAARTANVIPNATIATRYDFTTTGGGVVTADKCNFAWYASFSQPFSVQLTNCCAVDSILLNECASPIAWSKVGVGNKPTTALLTNPLVMSLCFAGGTLTDCVWARVSQAASGAHTLSLTDIAGFTFTRDVIRANTIRANATTYAVNGTRMVNCAFIDPHIIQGPIALTTCSGVTATNIKYVDMVSGTGTVVTYVTFIYVALSNTINCVFSGLTFPLTNQHPYGGLMSIGAAGCSNIKLRNIGTRVSPLNMGTANASGLIYALATGAAASDIKVQRVYCVNTRTGIMTGDNSSTRVTQENVYGDYADAADVAAVLNYQRKGIGGTLALTAQTAVYGTHWFDCFTGTTAGRLGILANEKTAVEPSASTYTITAGGTAFTSAGGLYMPTVGDQIVFTTPYYVLGITGFQNAAPAMAGGTLANYTLEYQIDKNDGSGYSAYKAMSAANLFGESGIDPAKGIKMRWGITASTANTTAITSLYILTVSTAAAQDNQYPLDFVTLTFTGLVAGSEVRVYRTSTGEELGGAETSSTTFSFTVPLESPAITAHAHIIKYDYEFLRIDDIVLSSDVSIPVQQRFDRNYGNP